MGKNGKMGKRFGKFAKKDDNAFFQILLTERTDPVVGNRPNAKNLHPSSDHPNHHGYKG